MARAGSETGRLQRSFEKAHSLGEPLQQFQSVLPFFGSAVITFQPMCQPVGVCDSLNNAQGVDSIQLFLRQGFKHRVSLSDLLVSATGLSTGQALS